ncbi:hypothetical protein EV182_002438 [Spiromyces aspiralis]|uniref:Uncharacterized protein n=1 Tax=Spiromyces aspiralis TaxID=68401 RepID=A0ACC1HU12_9FUNG|nr:hypothetical protein EV182_002438 [Spiromyces aspiralis]
MFVGTTLYLNISDHQLPVTEIHRRRPNSDQLFRGVRIPKTPPPPYPPSNRPPTYEESMMIGVIASPMRYDQGELYEVHEGSPTSYEVPLFYRDQSTGTIRRISSECNQWRLSTTNQFADGGGDSDDPHLDSSAAQRGFATSATSGGSTTSSCTDTCDHPSPSTSLGVLARDFAYCPPSITQFESQENVAAHKKLLAGSEPPLLQEQKQKQQQEPAGSDGRHYRGSSHGKLKRAWRSLTSLYRL